MTDAYKKVVFLDLEDTVIDEIDNPMLIRVHQVRRFLQQEAPEEVGIFSAALVNEEMQAFYRLVLPMVERAFNLTVDRHLIPTVEEVCRIIEQNRKLGLESVRLSDFYNFFRKEGGFFEYCRNHPDLKGCECVLLDDAVGNMEIHLPDRRLRLVNVTKN